MLCLGRWAWLYSILGKKKKTQIVNLLKFYHLMTFNTIVSIYICNAKKIPVLQKYTTNDKKSRLLGLITINSHKVHCKNHGIRVESLGNWGSKIV